jgi:acyl carrier protein
MTRDELLTLMRSVLRQIAPEVNLDDVDPTESIWETLDLDSIDFLNFVVGINERTGIEIPERDYPQLATVDGCVAYMQTHQTSPA